MRALLNVCPAATAAAAAAAADTAVGSLLITITYY